MKRYLIALALALGIVTASVATATATPYQDFKQTRIKIHTAVNTAKQNRCRGHAAPFKFRAYQIPARLWPGTLHFWRERRAIARSRSNLCLLDPERAIRYVFGGYAEQAISVAWCESRLSVNAVNGQYLGLFQMGEYARATYGHSSTALGQSRSAYAYFAASGYDWSPWECKP